MGLDKKKKEISEEKLRQRLLSERESRRIAQRFDSLEKKVHHLLTHGDSVDLQEALDRPHLAVPLTPSPPSPSSEHYREAAQWSHASGLERQGGATGTGAYSTPVPAKVLWTLLKSYYGVTPSYAEDVQLTPRGTLPITLNVAGMLHYDTS